ncbi:MAG: polysaccharide deacetylase family protein [Oscillospiraceae bacterium]|nr:polysaccharide deacetylase family protein [Oscillospiraceae bacterium]
MLILQTISPSIVGAADSSIDRAPLQALIAQAERFDGRDYTNATWRTLTLALNDAKAVLTNQGATQAEVDRAYGALQTAATMLVPIASFGNPFADVGRNDWFYGAALYANANALMQGTTATTFQPLGTLSRATVVTVLYRIEGEPPVVFEAIFDDVPADQWYSDAVIWAAKLGIVTGVGDDRFHPSGPITREDLATILRRYAAFKNYDVTVPSSLSLGSFADYAQVNSWASEAVRWAVYYELIRGSGGRLNPRGTATRAEYATILQRLIDNFEFDRQPATPQPEQHYIAWQFITYLEPNFMAPKQESYPAQTVNVLQRREDGWGQITTASGDRWVYLRADMRYIESTVYLYDHPNGSRGDRIEPQVVTILAQESAWYQISTWLGPKWIYLGLGPQPGGGSRIALTFDDGPSGYTSQLLDALYARNVPVTFFVLGQQVAAYPSVAQRIVQEGHELANHSYRHPDLSRMSAAGIRDELTHCRNIIYQITGRYPTLLRPPYGSHNATVQSVAREFGYPLILWSVDTRDWESRNVNAIMGHFVAPNGTVRIREGDIILMHDIYGTTIDAAINAIDLLLANGFEFVTVTELLAERHGGITPGKVYNR